MGPTVSAKLVFGSLLLSYSFLQGAPPKPPHDIWIEGETCTDHNFNTIGRDPAFKSCYESAILQLQTQTRRPPGGYHATYRPVLPEPGWWEVRLATTRPDSLRLCAYHVQITGYRSRRLDGIPVQSPYGPGGIFGWVTAGVFQLPKGEVEITLRCDERRRSENDYLLYIDALALRRVPPPADGPRAWIAGPLEQAAWVFERTFPATSKSRQALVSVLCDGRARVFLNGRTLGTATGVDAAARFLVPSGLLRAAVNRLRLDIAPGKPGGVLAWVDAADENGGRRLLCFTGDGQWRVLDVAGRSARPRRLGGMHMAPYGDMTVQPPPRFPLAGMRIPIKTGNLSVGLITAAARGQRLPEPRSHPEFETWKTFGGVSSVEDYICWLPLEPERGAWNWATYDENCRELRKRHMGYSVYPWLHFAPKWALASEFWAPLLCLRHGKSTWAPSVWSPQTLALFDRFYAELRDHFGDRISAVYVSMVADFGEIGYPIGMTRKLVPTDHIHPGFWCGDPDARADFRRFALEKYGSLKGVNDAWGTAFRGAGAIDYPGWASRGGYRLPRKVQARRRRLDFAEWYLGSMVRFAGKAVGVSRRHFPRLPHEIKIGFGSERLEYGADVTAYVKRSKTDGYTVRSTHGKLPMFFYRRFSTAAKFYGVPLVTEPPGGVSRHEEVDRIFKDATSGTTEFFDYPPNLLNATDLFSRFGRYMEGEHSLTDIAFFFPSTDHWLQPNENNPSALLAACAAARDYFDWDLVDERLVCDGALERYRVLLWPAGRIVPKEVFARIRRWVERGGILIRAAAGEIEAVDGVRVAGSTFLVSESALPPDRDLWAFDTRSRDAWYVDVGAPGDETVLAGDWNNRESGHWEWGGAPNSVAKRWSGPNPLIRLPVDPQARYHFAAALARHPKLLNEPCPITVNGVRVGEVPNERACVVRFDLGPPEWRGKPVAEIGFVHRPWRPCDIGSSDDSRTLGIAVNWVKVWKEGTPEPKKPNISTLRKTVRLGPVAGACRRRVDAGWTVLLPCRGAGAMADFARFVSAIVHLPIKVVPGYAGPALADDLRDDVWSALMPGRVLLLNRSDRTVRKVVSLDSETLARFGVPVPGRRRFEVPLAPHSLASVELPSGRIVRP
ncbi:MAG: family 14 glycosylhydrolase [Kiritimatiellaeota bacterium]|nr:family 14 glycosylhydrolase [Kiritimatiellota bacterium]